MFGLFCAVLKCIQYGYKVKTYRPRHHGTYIRIWFWRAFIGRLRHFSSEQHWHWWWHGGHYWHRLHTGYWKYTVNLLPVVHKFKGSGPHKVWHTGTSHYWRPPQLAFSYFHFFLIIQLVEETNRYCHQHLETQDEGQSPLPDRIVQEKHLFLAIILQMGHNQDTLEDY